VSWNVSTWVGQYAPLKCFVCGPKFTRFLLSNLGGAVVDHLFFRFLTCPPVPEIFAIKVESYQKSRRNLDVFWRSQKLYARYHPCLATRRLEKSREDVPTSPEVIGCIRWIFSQILNFDDYNFWRVPPSPLGCALSKLGQSVARIKI